MLKILFDATVLVNGIENEGERRGIFFTAKNILDQMLLRDDVQVVLYADICKIAGLKKLSDYKDVRKYTESTKLEEWLYEKTNYFRKKRLFYFTKPLIRKFYAFIILLLGWMHIFLRHSLIFRLKRTDGFIFFSPLTAPSFFIARNKFVNRYVILYDAIPFKIDEYKIQRKGEWFGHLVNSLNSNDCYFAISEKTKQDFCELFPVVFAEKVFVTPLAASEAFRPCLDLSVKDKLFKKYNLPKKKYIFSLCTLEPRKNIIRIVGTFIKFLKKTNITDTIFVLGGGSWNSFIDRIKSEVLDFDEYRDFIIWAGYVDDEDLPVFYSNAEWFVYTSQYEGFGLPPLEAMQCGCPVIASNNSSLPEVVGDAGIMIDWDSDEQHVEAYEKYYFDEKLRKENGRKGLERSKLFSWEKTVDEMIRKMKGGD